MSERKIFGIFLIILAIIYAVLFFSDKSSKELEKVFANYEKTDLTIGKNNFHTYISDREDKRERGLSGISNLEEGVAMLFVFEDENFHNFWMKDMNFPIDIIWIDGEKKIIEISNNITPETYPKTFTSQSPSKWVLEIGGGEAEKRQIKVGEKVEFGM